MTENRRIFWNIFATYSRSLYGLVLGLFCGRWALMALGTVDFGLYGLIGGLTSFLSFFNTILASANARFYAFSVGAAKQAHDKYTALEECRKWFNTAVSIHTVVPLFLVVIGYPIGQWAIEYWLTIPPDRIRSCILVFRFVCISCFISMVNVPFTAMYAAKQYIAELTIYNFITSTLNVIALYYMVSHPSAWLVRYAGWMCILSVTPQVIICIRAIHIFPECKIRPSYMWNAQYLKKIGAFSFWQVFGSFCGILRMQGMSIVINRFFGASMNAAQAIGNQVQGQCNQLASAMQGAFTPVITQACGAKDYKKMNEFALRVCKFNVLLSVIFMLPLALELPEVMRLWLKTPPDYTVGLCYCAMIHHLIKSCTVGHLIAVNASGRVAAYQVVLSAVNIFTIPVTIVIGIIWRNVYMMMCAVVILEGVNSIGRILFARRIVGMHAREWLGSVFLPLCFAIILAAAVGWLPHLIMRQTVCRVVITVIACESVLVPVSWVIILSEDERKFMRDRVARFINESKLLRSLRAWGMHEPV